MSVGLLIAVCVGAVVLIVKRFAGEPVDARDTFVTPLILVGIGVYSVIHVQGLSGADIGWLVLGAVVGIAFGAVRGTTTILFERDGYLCQRYTVKTLAVWGVSAVAGFGVSALGSVMGLHPEARPITLSIGVGMLGEMLTLGLRALSTGIPFAPAKRAGGTTNRQGAQDISSTLDRFLRNLGHPGSADPHRDTTSADSAPRNPGSADRLPGSADRQAGWGSGHPGAGDGRRDSTAYPGSAPRYSGYPPREHPREHGSGPLSRDRYPGDPADGRRGEPGGPVGDYPPRLDRSPSFRDGLDWLRDRRL
ncbi:hypothetical protein [Nocardia brasiliensis]|uniref:hypothetical protein n=1 Tax=Nocardia brasiliensis TaxID=37326 RepID=UPI001934356E|nr:hypothetical protein [Nocardia brasiliensis]